MKTKVLVVAAVIAAVLLYLMFVPSRLFSQHFKTAFEHAKFYCGQDLELTSSASGSSLIVEYSEYDEYGGAQEKAVELLYSSSTLFADFYLSKTGEQVEVDPELKLSGFSSGVGGVCY